MEVLASCHLFYLTDKARVEKAGGFKITSAQNQQLSKFVYLKPRVVGLYLCNAFIYS